MTVIKFYTEVHSAREAVDPLRQKGVDLIPCGAVGMSDADDSDPLMYAVKDKRVIVTCDADFERYPAEGQAAGRASCRIVYLSMKDQCQSISVVVRELLFLHEAADYQTDLYNQIGRAQA